LGLQGVERKKQQVRQREAQFAGNSAAAKDSEDESSSSSSSEEEDDDEKKASTSAPAATDADESKVCFGCKQVSPRL